MESHIVKMDNHKNPVSYFFIYAQKKSLLAVAARTGNPVCFVGI